MNAARRADHREDPPLEAVVFDLFHTLIDGSRLPPGTSTSEILGIDPDDWAHQVMEASPHHALGTETDPVESVRQIAHAIDPTIPMERVREAAGARPRRFRAALTDIRPDVLAAIAELHGRSLPLGLISNAGLDEVEAWDDSPLRPYFQAALFSCHEGVMKPEAEIYRRACARLGTRPERCLFVGDGGSQEHEGARAVGMRTVLFLALLRESYPETAQQRARVTDWETDSFAGLLQLVARLQRDGLGGASAGR